MLSVSRPFCSARACDLHVQGIGRRSRLYPGETLDRTAADLCYCTAGLRRQPPRALDPAGPIVLAIGVGPRLGPIDTHLLAVAPGRQSPTRARVHSDAGTLCTRRRTVHERTHSTQGRTWRRSSPRRPRRCGRGGQRRRCCRCCRGGRRRRPCSRPGGTCPWCCRSCSWPWGLHDSQPAVSCNAGNSAARHL